MMNDEVLDREEQQEGIGDKEVVQAACRQPSKSPSGHNKRLGVRGEEAAARYLERRGYDIVARNWTCFAGEADIICNDGSCLVFVEVKTRSNLEKGLPSEAVTAQKRAKYEKIAACFLQQYDAVDIPIRFDVVSILTVDNERALIRHHINAFAEF